LNKIINSIASFEQFIIHDIPLHYSVMVSSYFVITTAIVWIKKPTFNKLALMLIAIITVQICCLSKQWKTQNEQELIVFNVKKNTIVTERNGQNITVYATDSILQNIQKNNTITSYRIGSLSVIETKKKLQNFFYFNGKRIFIIDSSGIYPKKINPDVIILTHSTRINLDRLIMTLQPKIIVADASNYKTIQKLWKSSCEKKKIPFHATVEKGFYKLQ
jgi:competence protein ComEC